MKPEFFASRERLYRSWRCDTSLIKLMHQLDYEIQPCHRGNKTFVHGIYVVSSPLPVSNTLRCVCCFHPVSSPGVGSSWGCGTLTPQWETSWALWSLATGFLPTGACPSSYQDSSSQPWVWCASSSSLNVSTASSLACENDQTFRKVHLSLIFFNSIFLYGKFNSFTVLLL